jgi:hypothetical protein
MKYSRNLVNSYYLDTRFLDEFQTIHSKPIDVGNVEKNHIYNPDNDVDILLGIRERKKLKTIMLHY